jgi:G:T-mismatch repair DNA endonuclease (very short patch repair protein)
VVENARIYVLRVVKIRQYSSERNKKISNSLKEYFKLHPFKPHPGQIEKMVKASKNARKDVEKHKKWNEKISEKLKLRNGAKKPEVRELISIRTKEAMNKPEVKEKLRNFHLGKHLSDLTKLKMSMRAKERLKDKVELEKLLKRTIFRAKISPNKSERRLYEFINTILPNEYVLNSNRQFMINNMFPDLVNVNGKKKVIELFGNYWHRNDNPEERISKFKEYGFDCLVIWEHQLKNLDNLKEEILKFNKGE